MSTEIGDGTPSNNQIRLTRRPSPEIRLTRRVEPSIRLTPRIQPEPERDERIRITGVYRNEDPTILDGLRKTLSALNADGTNAAVEVDDEHGLEEGADTVLIHVTGVDTLREIGGVPISYLIDMERRAVGIEPDVESET